MSGKKLVRVKKLSWTAVRTGATYCAPGCGHGCTWAAYEKAVELASALVRELNTAEWGEWEPEVWENMGWHYAARRPHIRVSSHHYQGERPTYTAFLSRDPDSSGGHWTASSHAPVRAVAAVIKEARQELENMRALVEILEGTD